MADDAGDLNNFYGYTPSLAAGVIFLVIFSLLSIASVVETTLAWRRRRDLIWTGVIILGGLCEIIGWAGRIAAHLNPDGINQFLMQQVTLIIGPVFWSGHLYGELGAVMMYLSPDNPLVQPKWLAPIFILADIISLAVQGAGGGQAGSQAATGIPTRSATYTMMAGIAFQLVVMIVFVAVGLYLRYRHRDDPRWPQLRSLSIGWLFASLMIIMRGVFRTAELAEGWLGNLYTHEGYIIGLDAVPMVLCFISILVAHPLWTLPLAPNSDKTLSSEESTSTDDSPKKDMSQV